MTKHIEFLIEHYTENITKTETKLRFVNSSQKRRQLRRQIGIYKEFVAELKEVIKDAPDNSGNSTER